MLCYSDANDNGGISNDNAGQNSQENPQKETFQPEASNTTTTGSDQSGEKTASADAAKSGKKQGKKKKGFFKGLLSFLVAIILILVAALAILLAIGFFDKVSVANHTPDNFTLHVYVDNAYKLVNASLDTQAVDIALSSMSAGSLRSTLHDLKTQPFIHSKYFKMLADFPVYASLYADNSFLLVVDMGIRSGVTRFVPSLLPLFASKVPMISQEQDDDFSYLVLNSGSSQFFIHFKKNLIILSGSKRLLKKAVTSGSRSETVAGILKNKPEGLFSVSIRSNELADMLSASKDPLLNSIFSYTSSTDIMTVNFNLSNDELELYTKVPLNTDASGSMKNLLTKRSRIPSIVPLLPDSSVYSTVFSLGTLKEIWDSAGDLISPSIKSTKESADKALNLLLGQKSDDILFSWTGNEFGLFSMAESVDPVFFIKIADEAKRKSVFEKLFSSFLMDEKSNIIIDGIRLTQIEFPDFLRKLLEQFKVMLIQPYFGVYKDFILFSPSAETLAKAMSKMQDQKSITKTANWQQLPQRGQESMVLVFYNLNFNTPSLFKSFPPLVQSMLKLYRFGALRLSSSGNSLVCTLSAIPILKEGLAELDGFPLETKHYPEGSIEGGTTLKGKPYAFWAGSSSAYSVNLLSRESFVIETDGKPYIATEKNGNTIVSLWIVTEKGSVYRTNEKLEPYPQFPVSTGYQASAAPVLAGKTCLVPSGNVLLSVNENGEIETFAEFSGKIRNEPAVDASYIAIAPRSFDGELFLYAMTGGLKDGFPFVMNSLPATAPLLLRDDSAGKTIILAAVQTGEIFAVDTEAKPLRGFPLKLSAPVSLGPLWIADWSAFVVYTEDDILWKVSSSGTVLGSMPMKFSGGKPRYMTAFNADNKGRSELLITISGNAVYAYDFSLFGVPGFPVAGSANALFLDADGNGTKDIVTIGTDGGIHAYAY